MFKIGEFSKISLVSIKTLRYYDQVGLLKPARIDTSTGYRYYQVEQLPRLNKILALKELGLSLEQIKKLLDDNISTDEIRGMLKLKQAQVEQTIEQEQAKLTLIEAKLNFIDREGKLPDAEVALKAVPDQPALTIHEPAPQMDNWATIITETYAALRGHSVQQVRETPRSFAVFHGNQYDQEMVDWELAFPRNEASGTPVTLDSGRVLKPRVIPGDDQIASIVHRGPYASLAEGYSTLAAWIEENGFTIAGAGREVYLKIGFIESERHDNVTEIQFPVRRAE